MTSDDAKNMICPILSLPDKRTCCEGDNCALWQGHGSDGHCGLVQNATTVYTTRTETVTP